MNRRAFAAALVAALAVPSLAFAQAWPARTVTLVVPFPAGGATDIVARLVAQKLTGTLKQSVIVDNKAGATGAIGLNHVARSAPDGYTLAIATASSLGTNPAVSKVPFDPIADFTPIGLLAAEAMGLAVHPSVPVNNVREFIAYAKANPGKLNMASFGTGSVSHLAGELFSSMSGIKMVHVPYKGAAPATADLVAGQVQVMFNSISVFVAPAKAGKLKLLASGGTERSTGVLADVPTIAESGVPGFEASTWHAVLGPAGLSPEIVALLSREIGAALKQPDVQEKLASMSLEAKSATPRELSEQLSRDVAKWKKTVAEAGIKIQ